MPQARLGPTLNQALKVVYEPDPLAVHHGSSSLLAFIKQAMKRYGQPKVIVTDRLRSYRAAMNVIGNAGDQECGRWLNNRAENSHQPFRRREGAMLKFRDVKTLQKFASVHASIHNHFNLERHLNRREIFKQNRAAAMAEWRQLAA
jgi:putative transposase